MPRIRWNQIPERSRPFVHALMDEMERLELDLILTSPAYRRLRMLRRQAEAAKRVQQVSRRRA